MLDIAEREGIDLAASYAYSDSATDVPMLEIVGHPVAVNADRELGRIARDRQWETRTFTNQVPLRERSAMPPRRQLIAAGTLAALLAGATVGFVVWWRMRKAIPPPSRRARLARQLPARRRRNPRSRARRRPASGWAGRLGRSRTPAHRRRLTPRLAASSPRKQRGRARRG
jgi:hypothetical protein